MADAPVVDSNLHGHVDVLPIVEARRHSSSTSLRALWNLLLRRKSLFASILIGLLLLCVAYCLLAPNQYESRALVELRAAQHSPLGLGAAGEASAAVSALSAPVALETMADVLRSDQLAWRVIRELKLYDAPGFKGDFVGQFPAFHTETQSGKAFDPAAQAWLIERFQRRLRVQTLPRTTLLEIRFRSEDAALSAAVVNALTDAYDRQESEAQIATTSQASDWLTSQLKQLKSRLDEDEEHLSAYEQKHGLVGAPATMAGGGAAEAAHSSALVAIDELGRQLVAATTDRIVREAEYRAALKGDPELVASSAVRQQGSESAFATAALQQIRARRGDLMQEQAQLSAEHGVNFPRVVEIERQLQDLDRQKQAEDARLMERFRSAWRTATDREQLVRKSLNEATAAGLKQNQASTAYAIMRQEADSSHELYIHVQEKVDEAELAAGIHGSNMRVMDPAREQVKPVSPDLRLYLAITFFVGLWVALAVVLLVESIGKPAARVAATLLIAAAAITAHSQAPTPSTSGLPSGVARIPPSPETRSLPNPKEAPAVWAGPGTGATTENASTGPAAIAMLAVIGPGDLLQIGEYRTPEFRASVRVSASGMVTLPLLGETQLSGLDEHAAARAIETALVAKGMLLHPQVTVLVMTSAGQDVSVLGEVARPGVYPYGVHHRLLDVISVASGLAPSAGRLVRITSRNNSVAPRTVVLDPTGADATGDHNPELNAGDTVQVSRAGLVFVVGDVNRPGGFPVDPVKGLTVVQALSLAWGPTPNAATSKALLIREQKGGRTLTALNVKRLFRGLDPDLPVEDGDILFVPDSAAKTILNRTMESAIQSAIGVTIYSGLVYSQRY